MAEPSDIFIGSFNWQGMKDGGGAAYIGIFVNASGLTHDAVRVTVDTNTGENAIAKLTAKVDEQMKVFFL